EVGDCGPNLFCSTWNKWLEMALGPARLTSVQEIWAQRSKARHYVSRHALNPARRKRAPQGAGGIQAPGRRELQRAILHHQLGWQECQSISPSGVGGDR